MGTPAYVSIQGKLLGREPTLEKQTGESAGRCSLLALPGLLARENQAEGPEF